MKKATTSKVGQKAGGDRNEAAVSKQKVSITPYSWRENLNKVKEIMAAGGEGRNQSVGEKRRTAPLSETVENLPKVDSALPQPAVSSQRHRPPSSTTSRKRAVAAKADVGASKENKSLERKVPSYDVDEIRKYMKAKKKHDKQIKLELEENAKAEKRLREEKRQRLIQEQREKAAIPVRELMRIEKPKEKESVLKALTNVYQPASGVYKTGGARGKRSMTSSMEHLPTKQVKSIASSSETSSTMSASESEFYNYHRKVAPKVSAARPAEIPLPTVSSAASVTSTTDPRLRELLESAIALQVKLQIEAKKLDETLARAEQEKQAVQVIEPPRPRQMPPPSTTLRSSGAIGVVDLEEVAMRRKLSEGRNAAATCIQSAYRGFYTRRIVSEIRSLRKIDKYGEKQKLVVDENGGESVTMTTNVKPAETVAEIPSVPAVIQLEEKRTTIMTKEPAWRRDMRGVDHHSPLNVYQRLKEAKSQQSSPQTRKPQAPAASHSMIEVVDLSNIDEDISPPQSKTVASKTDAAFEEEYTEDFEADETTATGGGAVTNRGDEEEASASQAVATKEASDLASMSGDGRASSDATPTIEANPPQTAFEMPLEFEIMKQVEESFASSRHHSVAQEENDIATSPTKPVTAISVESGSSLSSYQPPVLLPADRETHKSQPESGRMSPRTLELTLLNEIDRFQAVNARYAEAIEVEKEAQIASSQQETVGVAQILQSVIVNHQMEQEHTIRITEQKLRDAATTTAATADDAASKQSELFELREATSRLLEAQNASFSAQKEMFEKLTELNAANQQNSSFGDDPQRLTELMATATSTAVREVLEKVMTSPLMSPQRLAIAPSNNLAPPVFVTNDRGEAESVDAGEYTSDFDVATPTPQASQTKQSDSSSSVKTASMSSPHQIAPAAAAAAGVSVSQITTKSIRSESSPIVAAASETAEEVVSEGSADAVASGSIAEEVGSSDSVVEEEPAAAVTVDVTATYADDFEEEEVLAGGGGGGLGKLSKKNLYLTFEEQEKQLHEQSKEALKMLGLKRRAKQLSSTDYDRLKKQITDRYVADLFELRRMKEKREKQQADASTVESSFVDEDASMLLQNAKSSFERQRVAVTSLKGDVNEVDKLKDEVRHLEEKVATLSKHDPKKGLVAVDEADTTASESFEDENEPVAKQREEKKATSPTKKKAPPKEPLVSESDANESKLHQSYSEVNEAERRILILREELKKRKEEAERLKREHKRKYVDLLNEKETSLNNQLKHFDKVIEKLEKELNDAPSPSNATAAVKPIIASSNEPQVSAVKTSQRLKRVSDLSQSFGSVAEDLVNTSAVATAAVDSEHVQIELKSSLEIAEETKDENVDKRQQSVVDSLRKPPVTSSKSVEEKSDDTTEIKTDSEMQQVASVAIGEDEGMRIVASPSIEEGPMEDGRKEPVEEAKLDEEESKNDGIVEESQSNLIDDDQKVVATAEEGEESSTSKPIFELSVSNIEDERAGSPRIAAEDEHPMVFEQSTSQAISVQAGSVADENSVPAPISTRLRSKSDVSVASGALEEYSEDFEIESDGAASKSNSSAQPMAAALSRGESIEEDASASYSKIADKLLDTNETPAASKRPQTEPEDEASVSLTASRSEKCDYKEKLDGAADVDESSIADASVASSEAGVGDYAGKRLLDKLYKGLEEEEDMPHTADVSFGDSSASLFRDIISSRQPLPAAPQAQPVEEEEALEAQKRAFVDRFVDDILGLELASALPFPNRASAVQASDIAGDGEQPISYSIPADDNERLQVVDLDAVSDALLFDREAATDFTVFDGNERPIIEPVVTFDDDEVMRVGEEVVSKVWQLRRYGESVEEGLALPEVTEEERQGDIEARALAEHNAFINAWSKEICSSVVGQEEAAQERASSDLFSWEATPTKAVVGISRPQRLRCESDLAAILKSELTRYTEESFQSRAPVRWTQPDRDRDFIECCLLTEIQINHPNLIEASTNAEIEVVKEEMAQSLMKSVLASDIDSMLRIFTARKKNPRNN